MSSVENDILVRLEKLEKLVESIVSGHAGDTRDELKKRVDELEIKLHNHFVATKQIM